MTNFESLMAGLSDEQKKTPTLRKWLQSGPTLNTSATYVVTQIWLPGKFANISFLTENFKVHVYEDNPSFKRLLKAIDEWSITSVCLCIKITDEDNAEFDLVHNPAESCDWEESNLGFRITVKEKLGSKNLGTKKRQPKQLEIPGT